MFTLAVLLCFEYNTAYCFALGQQLCEMDVN